ARVGEPYRGISLARAWFSSRVKRTEIGRKRDHVVERQLLDHRLHQVDPGPAAHAILHIVELAHHVEGIAVGDRRYLAEALETRSVTDGAGHRLAAAPRRDQLFALLDGARRDVVIEADAWIAGFGCVFVLRHRDDALAHPL